MQYTEHTLHTLIVIVSNHRVNSEGSSQVSGGNLTEHHTDHVHSITDGSSKKKTDNEFKYSRSSAHTMTDADSDIKNYSVFNGGQGSVKQKFTTF